MPASREYRDRDAVEVDILDALVARQEEGMTVFELRAHVDVEIGALEEALNELHDDDLIEVEAREHRSILKPAESVIPDPNKGTEGSWLPDEIRRRLRELRRRFVR